MGAYRLPRCACQPCSLIDGCFAIDLCHTLLWTGFAVPISSKGGALDVPHLDVRIGHGRAGIPAVAGVFELTVRPFFQPCSIISQALATIPRTVLRRHTLESVVRQAPELLQQHVTRANKADLYCWNAKFQGMSRLPLSELPEVSKNQDFPVFCGKLGNGAAYYLGSLNANNRLV